MEIMTLFFIAAITEAIVETIKKIHDFRHPEILAIVISIALSIATNACILCLAGISVRIPYLDACIAGILCSRGANFLHDFLKILENTKENGSQNRN